MNDLESMRAAMIHATVTSSFTIQGLGTDNLQDWRGAFTMPEWIDIEGLSDSVSPIF